MGNQGTIYKSTGSWYTLHDAQGAVIPARLKGKFKIEDITSTNPIAVGDEVDFEMEEGESTAIITALHPRKNYVNRVSPANKRLQHIIASNLDQSMLIATLRSPKTSMGFIDRFLVTCEAYHIPAILVFNKCDLYKEQDLAFFEDRKKVYASIGYTVLLTSVEHTIGVEECKQHMVNKTTLISGHSGVGKSSLINAIMKDANIKTQEVSDWSGKGMHTTTFAEMYDLPGAGRLIDTPGMREFAIAGIERGELAHYFPEMLQRMEGCQFNDCMHINEPGCSIKKAVVDGQIDEERYISYCTILDSIPEKEW